MDDTKRGRFYRSSIGEIKCRYFESKDSKGKRLQKNLIIEPLKKGRVWVGMEDMGKSAKKYTSNFTKIEYILDILEMIIHLQLRESTAMLTATEEVEIMEHMVDMT